MHLCTQIHTRSRTCLHAHTHMHLLTLVNTNVCTNLHAPTRAHTHTHMDYAFAQTHVPTKTNTHTRIEIHTYAHNYICAEAQSLIHACLCKKHK